jgi:hypothetical protein
MLLIGYRGLGCSNIRATERMILGRGLSRTGASTGNVVDLEAIEGCDVVQTLG